MEGLIEEKERHIEKLSCEVTERATETQRLSRQAKDSDNIRRELLNYKDMSSRLEAERFQHREKIAELETRITELSDLLNMEL